MLLNTMKINLNTVDGWEEFRNTDLEVVSHNVEYRRVSGKGSPTIIPFEHEGCDQDDETLWVATTQFGPWVEPEVVVKGTCEDVINVIIEILSKRHKTWGEPIPEGVDPDTLHFNDGGSWVTGDVWDEVTFRELTPGEEEVLIELKD